MKNGMVIRIRPVYQPFQFSCSYSNDSHAIVIVNEDSGNTEGENIGSNNTGTYTVNIYNDYGLVRQEQMSSGLNIFHIPMYSYPNGFYYVNIVDDQGNVVTRQTVQVQ